MKPKEDTKCIFRDGVVKKFKAGLVKERPQRSAAQVGELLTVTQQTVFI